MKVKELIEYLKTQNQEDIVKLADWGEHYRSPMILEADDIYTFDGWIMLGYDKI